jgi:hypothetical protein
VTNSELLLARVRSNLDDVNLLKALQDAYDDENLPDRAAVVRAFLERLGVKNDCIRLGIKVDRWEVHLERFKFLLGLTRIAKGTRLEVDHEGRVFPAERNYTYYRMVALEEPADGRVKIHKDRIFGAEEEIGSPDCVVEMEVSR